MESQSVFQAETQAKMFLLNRLPVTEQRVHAEGGEGLLACRRLVDLGGHREAAVYHDLLIAVVAVDVVVAVSADDARGARAEDGANLSGLKWRNECSVNCCIAVGWRTDGRTDAAPAAAEERRGRVGTKFRTARGGARGGRRFPPPSEPVI